MTELVRPQKAGQWSEAALRVLHERYLSKKIARYLVDREKI